MLTLNTFVGVGEEVVGSHNSQRDGNSQRFAEVIGSTAVDECSVVGGAARVSGFVVCENNALIRIRVENYNKTKKKDLATI